MSAIHATTGTPPAPPRLTAHMRHILLSGHRATLRRYQHSIATLPSHHPDAPRIRVQIGRLQADIGELEAQIAGAADGPEAA